MVFACNNKSTSSGESNETSNATETTSEVTSEAVEEEIIPENFKIVAKYADDNNSELNRVTYDYTIEIICKDDGSAKVYTKVISTDENELERNKLYYCPLNIHIPIPTLCNTRIGMFYYLRQAPSSVF